MAFAAAAAAVLGACSGSDPVSPRRLVPGAASRATAALPSVRFSEIHYDNISTDAGEAIEISGPAGTDVTGWKLVLYNGASTSLKVYDTKTLTGTLPATCGTAGVLVQTYPSNGIQNGDPDGFALVDAAGQVVEFLSYGGTFTAADGPAIGLTPTDIGVKESNTTTPSGQSLQRLADGTWTGPLASTFGACNDQGGTTPTPHTVAKVVVSPATATVNVGATQTLGAVALDSVDVPISGATFTWTTDNAAAATVSASGVVTGVANGSATITATSANGKTGTSAITVVTPPPVTSTARVTEIHYDNNGTDVNEGVEIEGDAGASLAGWSLVLYNQTGGVVYGTIALSQTIPATCGARGVVVVPTPGIQNGPADGVALVNAGGQVVEFLSYAGTLTATGGPAAGQTSTDIGVTEGSATTGTQSLQRAGNGTWFGPAANTFGACNPATPPARQGSLSLTSGKTSLAFAMQTQFFFSGTDASGATVTSVTWSTSDANVITADANGIVTAKGVGTAKLTATAADGTFGAIDVTVYLAAGATGIRLGHNTEFGEPQDANPSDDFLIRRQQYTVSYNASRGGANWVSWNLDASHVGSNGRCPGTCYSADTALTRAGLPAYTTADWVSNATYDRGHMAPSADWTSSEADNNTTFFLSNFLPQAPDLNQGPWEDLESALRDSVSAANGSREAYIIAGGIFTNGVGLGTLLDKGKIAIPDSTWKIAVITPAGTGINADGTLPPNSTVMAVNMPNVQGIRSNDWRIYLTTIGKIERSTGYDFLALLAESTECRVEARNCAPTARIGGAGTSGGAEGQALAFSASQSNDPNGDALSYLWQIDGANAGIQPTLTHTFADDGTYAVRLIVSDPSGAADTTTTMVTVTNVAPQIVALTAQTTAEGTAFSATGSFTDPGDDAWTATVDYGDGSGVQPLPLAGKSFSLGHTYADDKAYTVKVTVTEVENGLATDAASMTVTVTNVAPTVATFAGATILRGESYSATGSFTDPGTDTFTATVSYGDGTTGALPLSGTTFTLQHTYATSGAKTVTVTVTDDDGGSGARTATVTVLSDDAAVQALGAMVDALAASGKIVGTDVQSLQASVDAARKSIARLNPNPAANELDAFINKVDAMQQTARISASDATSLIGYAKRVIASIG